MWQEGQKRLRLQAGVCTRGGTDAGTDMTKTEEPSAVAAEIERNNPWWIVVFGVSSREFVCFPRFAVPPRTMVVAKYPGAIPPRMREVERLYLREAERARA